jgi:hypothetical protein
LLQSEYLRERGKGETEETPYHRLKLQVLTTLLRKMNDRSLPTIETMIWPACEAEVVARESGKSDKGRLKEQIEVLEYCR